MKNKVFIFVIGFLVGAILASAGFLIFGGNKNKGDRGNFDPSKFNNGDMTPPSGFSRDKGEFDTNKKEPNKKDTKNDNTNKNDSSTTPEKPSENSI